MATIEQGAATGVSFALSDEQKSLRELAREFAAKEIRPWEAEYDDKMQHPVDVIAKAHDLGLMNLHVPEEFGGPGLGCFDGLLVGEELYWGCSGIGTQFVVEDINGDKLPDIVISNKKGVFYFELDFDVIERRAIVFLLSPALAHVTTLRPIALTVAVVSSAGDPADRCGRGWNRPGHLRKIGRSQGRNVVHAAQ
jgi:hypothetical protein